MKTELVQPSITETLRPFGVRLAAWWSRGWRSKVLLLLGGVGVLGVIGLLVHKLPVYGQIDLRLFYDFGRTYYEGGELYQLRWEGFSYLYPPFFAGFVGLFAWVPYPVFALIFNLLSLLSTVLAVVLSLTLLRPQLKERQAHRVLLLGLLLSVFFIFYNLQYGQVNTLVLTLVLAGVYRAEQGGDLRAGVYLGLAFSVKLIPGVFILYFLLRGRWRILLSSAVVALVLNVVFPVVTHGFETYLSEIGKYISCMTDFLVSDARFTPWYTNQGLYNALARLLTDRDFHYVHSINLVSLSPTAFAWLMRGVKLAVLGSTAFALWRRRRDYEDRLIDYALMLAALLLLIGVTGTHHLTLLLPANLLLAYWFYSERRRVGLSLLVFYGAAINLPLLYYVVSFAAPGFFESNLQYYQAAHFFYPYTVYMTAVWGYLLYRRLKRREPEPPP